MNIKYWGTLLISSLLFSCQMGVGASSPVMSQAVFSGITPSSKGPTLEITPSSKGSTLLKGVVVWPEGVVAPGDMQFEVLALNNRMMRTQTRPDGSFEMELSDTAPLRLEARAMFDPELVFKTYVDQPEMQQEPVPLTLESTALTALMDKARVMRSPVMSYSMDELKDMGAPSHLEGVVDMMMPFLKEDMASEMEEMPTVDKALSEALGQFERAFDKN